RWLKPLLSSPFAEAPISKTAGDLMERMDAEVAALGRSTSSYNEALEKEKRSSGKELAPPPSQIPLELGGQRVAVDLAQRVGHVDLGVAAFLQRGHVVGDLVVLAGHLGDRGLPLLGLGRQVAEGHLDV